MGVRFSLLFCYPSPPTPPSPCIEKLVSNVHSGDEIDSATADPREAESATQGAQLRYEVWFPESTSTTSVAKERPTIRERLQELYKHTEADQARLKCKFMEICECTGKPELDPYYEVAYNSGQSTTRVDLIPEIISKCQLDAGVQEGRVRSDGNEIGRKRGMVSLQEWKDAVKKSKGVK